MSQQLNKPRPDEPGPSVRTETKIEGDVTGDVFSGEFHGPLNISPRKVSKKDILDIIYASEPDDFDYNDTTGFYVYIHDVQLHLVQERSTWFTEEGRDFDRFEEDWVKKFPNPKGYRQIIYINYGNIRIETFYTVLVDGGRYLIPYPSSAEELTISQHQYKIGQILNRRKFGVESFDFGLSLAKIRVED